GTLDPVDMRDGPLPQRATLTAFVNWGDFPFNARFFSTSMAYLTTGACTVNQLYSGGSITMFGIPEPLQRATDFHVLTATATTPNRFRSISRVFHTLDDMTINLPVELGSVTIASLPGGHKRLQATMDPPATFNERAQFRYNDGSNTVTISASRAYLGAGRT